MGITIEGIYKGKKVFAGTSKKTGKPFEMKQIGIDVGGFDAIVINYKNDISINNLKEGEKVKLVIEFNRGYLNLAEKGDSF